MSGANRNLYATVGIVTVIATVIALATLPSVPKLQAASYESARSKQYFAGGSECQPAALAAIRNNRKRTRQADTCTEKAEEYRLNTNDLIQQTRAANAAEASATVAGQGLWTAWFQTIGGFITLAAAIAAALYARDAAGSANRTLEHEKDVARIQLRPNVHIETVDVSGERDRKGPYVTFKVRNSGTVTAHHFRATSGWAFRPDDGVPRLNLSLCSVPKQITPGNVVTVTVPPSDNQIARVGPLFCQFEVSWKDETGDAHSIKEIHRSNGEEFEFLTDE